MKFLHHLKENKPPVSRSGFTLVELMIAMALSGILIASIGTAYVSQRRSATAQEQVAEVQQNLRVALYNLEHEIRMAGHDPRQSTGAGILTATVDTLSLNLVADRDGIDNDGDGTTDEIDELSTIVYQLADCDGDGDTDFCRYEGLVAPAPLLPVAENIDAVEFFYTLANGTQTTAPTAAQLADIRTVQISILARAEFPDTSFTNDATYIPASGNTWDLNGAAAGLGNPTNDNFRRRLLITTIQFRNLGL